MRTQFTGEDHSLKTIIRLRLFRWMMDRNFSVVHSRLVTRD